MLVTSVKVETVVSNMKIFLKLKWVYSVFINFGVGVFVKFPILFNRSIRKFGIYSVYIFGFLLPGI